MSPHSTAFICPILLLIWNRLRGFLRGLCITRWSLTVNYNYCVVPKCHYTKCSCVHSSWFVSVTCVPAWKGFGSAVCHPYMVSLELWACFLQQAQVRCLSLLFRSFWYKAKRNYRSQGLFKNIPIAQNGISKSAIIQNSVWTTTIYWISTCRFSNSLGLAFSQIELSIFFQNLSYWRHVSFYPTLKKFRFDLRVGRGPVEDVLGWLNGWPQHGQPSATASVFW